MRRSLMQMFRFSCLIVACLGCQEEPGPLGSNVGRDAGGDPTDLGQRDVGLEDQGGPDPRPPVILPAISENVSLQIRLVDYARTGDVGELPIDVRDDPPFAEHSMRVDVRTEIASDDAAGVFIHPPFGESSGPNTVIEETRDGDLVFASQKCAICVSATARVADSRFVVSRLALGTVVDRDGVRRWSGEGRIEGIEIDEGSLVSVDAASPLEVRLDDIAPEIRVETVPSVLLPFEGLWLRFSEPVLDQAVLIEVDTRRGQAELEFQPDSYSFDAGGSQVLGYGLSPAEPWPPGEITVRYFDPHADLSGNVGQAEDFVVPVHRDPRASERVGFENSLQDHSAWGPNVDRQFVDDRCIEDSCLIFEVGESSDAGVLTRLAFGSPIESVGFQVRLLSETCSAGLDLFSVAVPWGEAAAFAGRAGRSVRTTSATPDGGCDSGWVQMEAPLPAPNPEAWLSIELRPTLDRSPPLILLVDQIVPRPALP